MPLLSKQISAFSGCNMIDFQIKNSVAYVTLNRPEVHNAFNEVLIQELEKIFRHIDHEPNVRVMVLAAAGKTFSAGADLQWMQKVARFSEQENTEDALGLARMMANLHALGKPTIVKIQGAAYGGGVGLIAACDIAVASHSAIFCLSEVKLGVIPAVISPYVIKAIGERQAGRYFLTAETFDARTAQQIGLIHSIVQPADLDLEIEKIIQSLLQGAPLAQREAKKLVHEVSGQPINMALIRNTAERIARRRVSIEGQEGINAFLKKMPPSWQKTKNKE